jgi:hypothetical protein
MFKPVQMFSVQVESDSTYAEAVLRGIGRIKAAHMLDCEEIACEAYDEEYIGRYSRLLEGIQLLRDIIQSQSALTPKSSKSSTIEFDFSETVFDGLPFRERLNYLEKGISQLEDLIGVHAAEVTSVLSKDVLVVLDGSIIDLLRGRGVVPAWIGSSELLYVLCGAIEPKSLGRLRLLLAETTGDDHMISAEKMPKRYGGRVLVTAITLRTYEAELEKFVGFVPCKTVAFRDIPVIYLRMLERLISRELDLAVQAKNSIGTLDSLLGGGGKTYSFHAWVPKKRLTEFKALVDEASGGTAKVTVRGHQSGEEVPTLLDNPFPIKSFESVLEMFSLPSYDEFDPTLFMAFFLMVLFGLMFGDVGHGALIVLCGLSVSLVSKEVRYRDLGAVTMLCGIAAVFSGLLYGSVFGLRDVIEPMWRRPVFDMGFMSAVIALGIAHMSLGLVIGIVNRLMVKREGLLLKLASVLSNVSQLMLFSSVLLLLSYDYLGVSSMIAISVFLIVLPLSVLLIFLMHPLLSVLRGDKLMLSDDMIVGISDVFHVMMLASNMISYIRVLILALIHEVSGEIVLQIGGMAGGIPFVGVVAAPLIFVVGTVVILLEGVITFIQGVRLNYYEFFNKFYKGGGLKYEPFSLS